MGERWIDRPRVARLRRRFVSVDISLRVADNYSRHRTGRNASLLAYFGFLSVFPLILALTAVLGFVLQNRPDLQDKIINSALNQLPIVGQTIGTDPSALRGNTGVLVVGLVLAIWSGMRAFVVLQTALDDVRELTDDERCSFVRARVKAFVGMLAVGGAQVATVAINAVATAIHSARIDEMLLLVGGVAINTAILAFSYRELCSVRAPWREVLPGAFLGGVAFSVLQALGTSLVARSLSHASFVYGTFASVIALIWWLGLHSTAALIGAELNHALVDPGSGGGRDERLAA
jgi:YihY family inner membrane protein